MELSFVSKLNGNKRIYELENTEIKGWANTTLGLTLQHLCLQYNSKKLELKQTNILLKFINNLPIVSVGKFVPYLLFENDVAVGGAKTNWMRPYYNIKFKEDIYELRSHSNNYTSLTYNDDQVALFHKKILMENGKKEYTVDIADDFMDKLDLLFLFGMLMDVDLYSLHNEVYSVSYTYR